MKKLLLGFVALIALAIGAKMLITPEAVNAQPMEKANAVVQQDAQKLAKQVETTNTVVQQIARDIETNDKPAISKDLVNLKKMKADVEEGKM